MNFALKLINFVLKMMNSMTFRCLRQTRSLAPGEELYGFGQAPQEGLSAVGNAKLLATSSRNQLDGPSTRPRRSSSQSRACTASPTACF